MLMLIHVFDFVVGHKHFSILQAYVDLIKEWAVDQFVVIYEDELGLVRMQDVLTQFAPPKHNVYLAQLPNDARNDFKSVISSIL